MLPRAVSEWASAASRELYSILPKVYDINQTNRVPVFCEFLIYATLKAIPRRLILAA
eukprot:COSAG02_NODE_1082_length_14704_cov_49.941664_7_plen_57_part_00